MKSRSRNMNYKKFVEAKKYLFIDYLSLVLILLGLTSLSCNNDDRTIVSFSFQQKDTVPSFEVVFIKSNNAYQLSSYSSKKKKTYEISYLEDDFGIHIIQKDTKRKTAYSFSKLDTTVLHEVICPAFFDYSSTLKRVFYIPHRQQRLVVYEFVCNSRQGEDSEFMLYYLKEHGFVALFNANFDALFRVKKILNTNDTRISSNILFVSNHIADSIETTRKLLFDNLGGKLP